VPTANKGIYTTGTELQITIAKESDDLIIDELKAELKRVRNLIQERKAEMKNFNKI